MWRTRREQLRFAIAFALIRARKIVRGLHQGLTEEERYAVADTAVDELEKHGDPWRLSWPVPAPNLGHVAQPRLYADDERPPATTQPDTTRDHD
jgi:hypothetical protein